MISIYNPVTGGFEATQGVQGVSAEILLLNILIELRVANQLALNLARGEVNGTPESLRIDVTTEVLPATV